MPSDLFPATPRSARLQTADWSEALWLDRLSDTVGPDRQARAPLAGAVPAMLIALGWTGTARSLAAHLPPPEQPLTPELLRRMLADLGFLSRRLTAAGDSSDTLRLRAGSVALSGDKVLVYLGRPDGRDTWWTSEGQQAIDLNAGDTILAIDPNPNFHPANEARPNWFRGLFERMRDELFTLLALSGFINLLALAVAMYTKIVYGMVIPSGTAQAIWGIFFFTAFAIVAGWMLRIARQSVISRIGGWAGTHIGTTTMRKMLSFPLDTIARAGVLSNVVRMRGFANARQFLVGTGGNYIIDYPFVVIFLLVLALFGGVLVIVPILSLLLYAALAYPTSDYVSHKATAAGIASGRLDEHASAVLSGIEAFHRAGAGSQWINRFADLARDSAARSRDYAIALARAQAIGQAIGNMTVLATMCTGIWLVLEGAMSAGSLVASMMLIWRVVTPAQQTFASLVRMRQVGGAAGQIDKLMATQSERGGVEISSPGGLSDVSITVERLYYRPNSELEAALNGVSFAAPAGKRIAIVGPNAGGKTILLECLAGLRRAQSGRVFVNGRDIRQFDVTEYRAWIGYVPQVVPALPITVRDYLRLRVPALRDSDALRAFDRVLGGDWIHMPEFACAEGTILDRQIDPFNDNHSEAKLRYLVAFVGATLGNPAVLLLDGVGLDGDPQWDKRVERYLDSIRGHTTVIWSPYSAAHIQGSDQVVILDRGTVRHAGPAARPQAKAG